MSLPPLQSRTADALERLAPQARRSRDHPQSFDVPAPERAPRGLEHKNGRPEGRPPRL